MVESRDLLQRSWLPKRGPRKLQPILPGGQGPTKPFSGRHDRRAAPLRRREAQPKKRPPALAQNFARPAVASTGGARGQKPSPRRPRRRAGAAPTSRNEGDEATRPRGATAR